MSPRTGLDTPWRLRVDHPGGFDAPVVLETSADYFEIYAHQAFYPAPESETRDDEWLLQEYEPPPGERLSVSFDGFIQPDAQTRREAAARLIMDGVEVARMHYRTSLLP